ncbi:hypothetical protein ACFOY2_20525 [Nonomuraea purpurea]|uniref:Uncharacterized protein n=1 Tax=Nonomuraea purpurea TaxID=1849276 RepID=A0ABV8G9U5_9ACTN
MQKKRNTCCQAVGRFDRHRTYDRTQNESRRTPYPLEELERRPC